MIVLGVSSGTSADGIDVAAARLELDGALVSLTPLGHRTVPYTAGLRREIRDALPPAATTMETLCRLDTRIGQEFGRAARLGAQDLAGGRADLVASHGQTLFHWVGAAGARDDAGAAGAAGTPGHAPEDDGAPAGVGTAGTRATGGGTAVLGTLQLGQPAWIAEATGLPVVSDLRTADVAAGGQGAPLAALLDVLLLAGRPAPTTALNLGGIANATVVREDAPPEAFDTGPGNALLDAATRLVTGGRADFDADGALARSGRPEPALLALLLAEPYYRLPPPKTTGLELFHPGHLRAALDRVGTPGDGDLLATLVEVTAVTVADALRPYGVADVLASGGGTRNPVLMERLAARLHPARLDTVDALGLDGDAKEAYLFALIGFLSWHGLPGSVAACTGARRAPVAGRLTPGAGPLRLPAPATTHPARLRVLAPDP